MHFHTPLPVGQVLDQLSDRTPRPIERVRLPRDELRHPHTMEWWYFIGYLRTASGSRATILCSAIRKRVLRVSSMTNCILKIWDHEGRSWPFVECGQPFAAGYSETVSPVAYQIDYRRNSLMRATCFDGGWLIEGAPHRYRLSGDVSIESFGPRSFDLVFRPTNGACLLSGDGVMDYGAGYQLAYYVRPKIEVTGTMQLGAAPEPVTGFGWYERQWGEWPGDAFGWKYLNIHLDNGEQWLIFSSLRNGLAKRYAARFPQAGGIEEFDLTAAQFQDVQIGNYASGTDVSVQVGSDLVTFTIRAMQPNEAALQSRYPLMPAIWEGVSTVECRWPNRTVQGIAMTEIKPYE